MFNGAFVLLSSTFYFAVFSNKKEFLSCHCLFFFSLSLLPFLFLLRLFFFLFFFFFTLTDPFCYRDSVFEMYLTELNALACSPLSGFFCLVLFVLSLPTMGADKWWYLKSLLKMTWPIFHLISPQQTVTPGHCHRSLFEWRARSCDPSRPFFFFFLLWPCFGSVFRPPPSLRPALIPRPRARAEGGEVIVANECIELHGNPAEEKGHTVQLWF